MALIPTSSLVYEHDDQQPSPACLIESAHLFIVVGPFTIFELNFRENRSRLGSDTLPGTLA